MSENGFNMRKNIDENANNMIDKMKENGEAIDSESIATKQQGNFAIRILQTKLNDQAIRNEFAQRDKKDELDVDHIACYNGKGIDDDPRGGDSHNDLKSVGTVKSECSSNEHTETTQVVRVKTYDSNKDNKQMFARQNSSSESYNEEEGYNKENFESDESHIKDVSCDIKDEKTTVNKAKHSLKEVCTSQKNDKVTLDCKTKNMHDINNGVQQNVGYNENLMNDGLANDMLNSDRLFNKRLAKQRATNTILHYRGEHESKKDATKQKNKAEAQLKKPKINKAMKEKRNDNNKKRSNEDTKKTNVTDNKKRKLCDKEIDEMFDFDDSQRNVSIVANDLATEGNKLEHTKRDMVQEMGTVKQELKEEQASVDNAKREEICHNAPNQGEFDEDIESQDNFIAEKLKSQLVQMKSKQTESQDTTETEEILHSKVTDENDQIITTEAVRVKDCASDSNECAYDNKLQQDKIDYSTQITEECMRDVQAEDKSDAQAEDKSGTHEVRMINDQEKCEGDAQEVLKSGTQEECKHDVQAVDKSDTQEVRMSNAQEVRVSNAKEERKDSNFNGSTKTEQSNVNEQNHDNVNSCDTKSSNLPTKEEITDFLPFYNTFINNKRNSDLDYFSKPQQTAIHMRLFQPKIPNLPIDHSLQSLIIDNFIYKTEDSNYKVSFLQDPFYLSLLKDNSGDIKSFIQNNFILKRFECKRLRIFDMQAIKKMKKIRSEIEKATFLFSKYFKSKETSLNFDRKMIFLVNYIKKRKLILYRMEEFRNKLCFIITKSESLWNFANKCYFIANKNIK